MTDRMLVPEGASMVPDAGVEDEEESVRKARRRAAWGLAGSALLLGSLAFARDPWEVVGVGLLLIPATLWSYRELRRPADLLQVTPAEIVARTLEGEGTVALPGPESRPERADRLLRLQDELDRLEKPESMTGRLLDAVLLWGAMVLTLLLGLVAILGGVLAESLSLVILGTAGGATSGGLGMVLLRQEKRRREAKKILEEEIAALRDKPDLRLPP